MTAVQYFNVTRNGTPNSIYLCLRSHPLFADRWTAIRKFDTNHLILGAKFAESPTPPVLKACGEYCDVVSIDYYPVASTAFFNEVFSHTKKPIFIAEFSIRARVRLTPSPPVRSLTQ